MLRELVAYSNDKTDDESSLDVPLGYRSFTKPIKWFLEVGASGKGRIVEGAGNPPRPYLKRSSAVVPLLLVDESPYVLGKGEASAADRTKRSLGAFWSLMEKAQKATGSGELAQILRVRQHWPPDGMERVEVGDTVGVKAEGRPVPTSDRTIQSFWLAHASSEVRSSIVDQCGVCGSERPLIRLLPFGVKGFAQDVQIMSFNLDAFQSFGKQQGLNAPTCFECASKSSQALSHLLRKGSPNKVALSRGEGLGGLVAVYWCKLQVAEADGVGEFDVLEALRAPIVGATGGAESISQDLGKVQSLLNAPWRPRGSAFVARPEAFNMLVLSNNVSRLVVRDWLHGTLEEIKSNLAAFLEASCMVGPWGEAPHPTSIRAIVDALESNNPNATKALLESAYSGTPVPDTIGALAVTCLRNTRLWKEPREAWRTRALLCLVRIQRTLHRKDGTVPQATPQMDSRRSDAPYLCGRLLAVLERAQGIASSWGVGATVVDRTFGAAAAAPKITFPPLLKMAVKAHLPSAGKSAREAMDEVMAAIDVAGGFPVSLSLAQQADFALGFYHQRAEFRAQAKSKDEHPRVSEESR
jgi:CRISPR-associated protein Csd1